MSDINYDQPIGEEASVAHEQDADMDYEFTGFTEPKGSNFDFGIMEKLRTPTGEGSIEDYLDHPLNFAKSRAIAQILRGATGFCGDLKLAIVDVTMGIFNLSKESKGKKGNKWENVGTL